MKTIHIVLGKANPNRMNGVNKVVYQLVTEQINHGFDAEVWGIAEDTFVNYESRTFKTTLFQKNRNPFSVPTALKKALKQLDSANTNIHLHGSWIPVFSSITRYASRLGLRLFVTPHGGYNTIAMKKNAIIKKFYFQYIEKPMLKRIDRIHVIGMSEIDGLKKIYPNEKQVLIPYGFKQTIEQSKTTQSQRNDFVVGFVGRIDIWTKGLDLLVDAFEDLPPTIKLWIIGEGKEMSTLKKRIAEKNLTHRIELFGSRFGNEKDALIAQMDVFVHPSRNEGLPSSVLEACNLGIPSIVSKETNVSRVVESFEAGIELPKNNITELRTAIVTMDRAKRQGTIFNYSQNAQRMVREAFNWSNIIQTFNKMYYSV